MNEVLNFIFFRINKIHHDVLDTDGIESRSKNFYFDVKKYNFIYKLNSFLSFLGYDKGKSWLFIVDINLYNCDYFILNKFKIFCIYLLKS